MAEQIYFSVFTTQGLALLTEAIQNGTKLGITEMAFGDGGGSLPSPDADYVSLINEVHRTSLNSLAPDPKNANWLRAEAIIASAIGGFNIRELGLYAGDVLVAYSNYPPTFKPNPSDGTARIMTFRMVLQIDNVSNFELVIDPDVVLATREYVDSTTKIDKIKFNNFINLEEKIKQFVSLHDYGAIGDGSYHPLSERYSTLDLAKFAYANIAERITSLNQSIDWAACQSAIVANQTVYATAKRYVLTDTIIIPDGHALKGRGVDYWDSYRPNPTELPKSDSNGTHFYFYGQGAKVHYIDDIANTLPPKSEAGVSYELTHFTNQDATATTSATPRMFSVGIKVGKNSNLEGCRAIPYYNGLQGYIDGTGLSDEWDVGVWVVSANDCQVDNVQSVGHWRMCGVLLTEHQDKSEGKRNPERCNFNRVWGSGVRGLIARNTPQYECTAYTSSTLTIQVNNTETISSVGKFRTSSSGTIYSFTGSTKSGNSLTLTGVSPSLTGLPVTVRAWNAGNNFSNTVFNNCIFSSLDHVSGQSAESFGLPVSGAAEFDGYPLRNLVFINSAFQTTYDDLNTIWGNCYDLKYIACKHENGQKIAYSNTQTKMFTMNIRMLAEDAVNAESWTLFTPRSGFNDALQIQQTFTDSIFQIQPLIGHQLKIMDDSSSEFLEALPGGVRRISFDNYLDIKKNGINNSGITLTEANTTVKNNIVASNGFQFSGTVRPVVDGSTSIGTSSFYLANIFTKQVMFTPTCGDFSGVGSPEGVITAGIGSTYRRRDGLANTCFYVKESGTGNIGWVAK